MLKATGILRAGVALVAWVGVVGCAPMTVNAYLERGANLRQYHTYMWGPADVGVIGDPRLDNNPFFDRRVREQVEKQLARRGFERSTASTADLLVHYHASVTQQVDVRNFDRDYTYCQHADCRPFIYDAGTIFIDMVDPRTKMLVWRGWAESSIDGLIDRQDWIEQHVDNAVRRIIDRLPNGM